MPKFKCINESCSKLEQEITVGKVKFVFNEKLKTLKPSPPITCSECGQELESISTGNLEGFCFNKFDSLNTQQKREVIKKRSQSHFQKHDKGDLANYKKRIIEDNKKMVRGEL